MSSPPRQDDLGFVPNLSSNEPFHQQQKDFFATKNKTGLIQTAGVPTAPNTTSQPLLDDFDQFLFENPAPAFDYDDYKNGGTDSDDSDDGYDGHDDDGVDDDAGDGTADGSDGVDKTSAASPETIEQQSSSLSLQETKQQVVQAQPEAPPQTTNFSPIIFTPPTSDPFIKRLLVLTTVELNSTTPCPKISTQTFAFSSQYRTVARVLQKMVEVATARGDDDLYPDVFEQEELVPNPKDPFTTIALMDVPKAPTLDDKLIAEGGTISAKDGASQPQRVAGKPLSIYEKIEQLCLFDARIPKFGLNNYQEGIDVAHMECLLYCHQVVVGYFSKNNDFHNGKHHSFVLNRYVVDGHQQKTFLSEVNLLKATRQQLEDFLKT